LRVGLGEDAYNYIIEASASDIQPEFEEGAKIVGCWIQIGLNGLFGGSMMLIPIC
jgi:hypothetical protein